MHPATLAGIPGAAEVRSRRRNELTREYRGTFAFRKQHEADFVRIYESRERVTFEGRFEGERTKLDVVVTDLQLEIGFVFFQGEEAVQPLRATAGE